MDKSTESGLPSAAPIAMDDIMARWAHREVLEAQLLPANKANILSALAAAGIATVVIRFDGCGDSGQIEEMEAHDGQGVSLTIPATLIEILDLPWDGEIARAQVMPLDQSLEAYTYRLLGSSHPGWENNDGAFGEFSFDVVAGTIRLDHHERYTAIEDYSHEY